jgi:cell fate regulator YaaT (PSP1 superfamily)
MPECIAVRFDNGPKLHYVEVPQAAPEVGVRCVVTTRRGLELATVRSARRDHSKPAGHFVREALPEDLEAHARLRERAEDLKWLLRQRVREQEAEVKVISLEFSLDEALLVVSYSGGKRAPLRVLAQELLPHTDARIEFDNVGPRDQARILGTLGACGMGNCSHRWMQSLSTVSIRMVRDQQLPLSPEKISGPCGRLMCCLQFEHEMYQELLRDLPRKGTRACHSSGACGRIGKLNPLKQTVELETDEGKTMEVPASELERPGRSSRTREG